VERVVERDAGVYVGADPVKLELLRRSVSAFPDEPVNQIVHQALRLFSAAARMGQDPARQVRHREREEQPVEVHLNGAGQDPVRGELIPGKARTRRGDGPQRPPGQRIRIFTFSLTGSFTSPAVLCPKRGLGGRAG
jgi:hypothetical protein